MYLIFNITHVNRFYIKNQKIIELKKMKVQLLTHVSHELKKLVLMKY